MYSNENTVAGKDATILKVIREGVGRLIKKLKEEKRSNNSKKCKPKVFKAVPISIMSTVNNPYEDAFTSEGLLKYRYRKFLNAS